MICPECKAAYREGFTECYDCQIPLVESLPPEEEEYLDEVNPVIVFATGNPVLLALAKSVLDEAEIEYTVSDEDVRFLLGAGGSGIGFNPTTGPAKIRVMPEDVDQAADLLSQVDEANVIDDEDDESE